MFVLTLLRRLFEAASTLFLVTAVAAFVWLYAEQKTVNDIQTPLAIEVEYGTPEQRRDLLVLTQGAPHKIAVSFKSNNRTVDEIKAKLAGGTTYTLPLESPGDKDSVIQTFSLRERLEKTLFHNMAASNIEVAQNPQVTLTVKKLKTVELPLDIDSGIYSIEWGQKPEKVSVRLPATIADIWKAGEVKALARLDPRSLNNVRPGEKVTRQVAVEIPTLTLYLANPAISAEEKAQTQEHLDLAPATLSATFTLDKSADAELRLTLPVPVTVSAPPSLLGNWDFSIPDANENFLNDLKLSCTPEAADRIKKNEEAIHKGASSAQEPRLVWAVVRVTTDQIPANGLLTLPLEVMTPSGATVSASTLLPKTVTVKAVRRTP